MLPGQNPGQQVQNGMARTWTRFHADAPLHQVTGVRSSLDLTADQLSLLNAADSQVRRQYQDQLGRLSTLTPAARAAEFQKLQGSQEADFLRSARGVLNPEQLRRFQQLDIQSQGPAAFENADIRARLNLTGEQVRRLQDLQRDNVGFLQEFASPGGSGQDPVTRYEMHQLKMNQQVNAVLNADQRRVWQEIIGDPFIFWPNLQAPQTPEAAQNTR